MSPQDAGWLNKDIAHPIGGVVDPESSEVDEGINHDVTQRAVDVPVHPVHVQNFDVLEHEAERSRSRQVHRVARGGICAPVDMADGFRSAKEVDDIVATSFESGFSTWISGSSPTKFRIFLQLNLSYFEGNLLISSCVVMLHSTSKLRYLFKNMLRPE